MAVAICQRLRRSRETWERVAYLVRNHLRLVNAPQMRLSTLKRFLAEDGIDELLELARLDALASNKDLTYYDFCRQKLDELGAEEIKPPPLVRGHDLLELGFAPGPRFRRDPRRRQRSAARRHADDARAGARLGARAVRGVALAVTSKQ